MSNSQFQCYSEWSTSQGKLASYASHPLAGAKMAHVVLDSKALDILLNDARALAALKSKLADTELVFDVDVALMQRHHPSQISAQDLWAERVEVLEALDSSQWQSRFEHFSEHVEQLYGVSFSTYGLLNNLLQSFVEGSSGTTLQQRIAQRVRNLGARHNSASALYPDEFLTAAARAVAFASALPLGQLSKDIAKQARYIEHTWAPVLWARAAQQLRVDEDCVILLLTSQETAEQLMLAERAPLALAGSNLPGELSYDLMKLFFAALQHQLPVAHHSHEAQVLGAAVIEGQRSVESAVMVDHARKVHGDSIFTSAPAAQRLQ